MICSTIRNSILLIIAWTLTLTTYAQRPTITSFSPTSGPVGTLVHIKGNNLSSPTAFTIGGVSAIVVSDADTTLVGMIMPGASTGCISIIASGDTAISTDSFAITPTLYPTTQQRNKLVGTGSGGAAEQGVSVAISADGSAAIVGGWQDIDEGAVWVYTRSGGVWIQQGTKLVGTGAVGDAAQGISVAISADGNTAIVGGYGDSIFFPGHTGAAWIFTRMDNTWTQQGSKLVGSGSIGHAGQGSTVAISADGNTAVIGGPYDDGDTGAIWIFSRSDTTWTQQGPKLVGSGTVMLNDPHIYQGSAVSISADGNTVIEGGNLDNFNTGAAWVFTRTAGVWTQQGPKLVGTGATGAIQQGWSVSISADGNTAIVGGVDDNTALGAAWVYTRYAGVWTQQGNKLSPTGAIPYSEFGTSVALSSDGNTAIIGGNYDSSGTGATWVFTRSGSTWTQQGRKLVGSGAIGAANQGTSVALSADGHTAIIGGPGDNSDSGAAWIFVSILCSPNSYSYSSDICQGDTFAFGSHRFSTQGTYIDTFTNFGGCDSIVTLYLTVRPLDTVSVNITLCYGNSYTMICGGNLIMTYSTSGEYIDTLMNAYGCDSIVTTYLTILPPDTQSLSLRLCYGETISVGGHTYDSTGTYRDTLMSVSGCDSITTTYLTVLPFIRDTIYQVECPGSFYVLGSDSLYASGHYSDTLTGASGCDSIVTLTLAFYSSYIDTLTDTVCGSYSFYGHILTASGIYMDTLQSVYGCDSIVTLQLTVNPLPVVTWLDNDTFFFDWCNPETLIIPLDSAMPMGGSFSGNYVTSNVRLVIPWHFMDSTFVIAYTIADSNNCISSVSKNFHVIIGCEGINEVIGSDIHLYPNPNRGSFTLETSGSIRSDYTISDMLGHVIAQQPITAASQAIDMPDAVDGVYTLTVYGAQPIRFVIVR